MAANLRIGCDKVELTGRQQEKYLERRLGWWEKASLLESNWLIVWLAESLAAEVGVVCIISQNRRNVGVWHDVALLTQHNNRAFANVTQGQHRLLIWLLFVLTCLRILAQHTV